ncbi:hypothetical protein CBR_g3163 [Chara braunii]|uniref:Retrotransposon gag domain-containing protein n=1 Tax=Chara braunii TaxID=69332 RepID=A0A388KEY2_CHABU|nr:hypothetical protein CBR_g3163 [Chara braunii]|eukprot:GBG68622.1 hypothetical protein CBR_g3163 [Chara braunii]
MPDSDGIERGPGATPEDFVKALEKREMARLQVPKVNIFHSNGDRVSEWLELLEQVTCEASKANKFKLMPRYVWWELRPEVMKVAAGANGEWARFKEEMQRRFKLGDDLLTKEDLEMLRRDEFSTVGAFATTFEKMAKKVPGLAKEEHCATFLGHFKNWEASSLTKKAAPGKKLTWGAIKEGVLEGELDQVDIFQMKQARKKRKALDTITTDGRNFKLMIEEAVAQHDAEKEARKKAMVAPQAQGKGKKVAVLEEEEEKKEEPEPQKLTKAQRKARNTTQGGQGSGKGQAPQAVAMPPPESSGQAAPAPYGSWPGCGPPSHWHGHCSYAPWPTGGLHGSCAGAPMSTASCGWPGPQSQQDGLMSSSYDGDFFDMYGECIDPRIPGGIREEALRRANAPAPPAPPTAFRIWQEVEDHQGVRIEEISESEEVEQRLRAGTIKEEPIVVESDGEGEEDNLVRARDTMEKMEDLLAKIGRYQDKLTTLCEEANRWKGELPLVYLIDSGLGAQGGSRNLPGVAVTKSTPMSGMTFRPPSRAGRAALAARTRSKGAPDSSQPTQDKPGPSGEKETVEIPKDEEDEDERLRTEEDKKAEERAKKRDEKAGASKEQESKRRKYKVRMEEGFDVEGMVDRLLEGHNDLMNLKDILASAPKLRDELKARLSRRFDTSFWAAMPRGRGGARPVETPLGVTRQGAQRFEIRKQPAEEAFKCQKVEERANEQKDEEIPLLDKEMLQPKEALAGTGSETGGFEWRMPTALEHEARPPAEDAMDEAALPMTQGETVGRQEVQESVGQAMAEAEEREEREVSQKTPPPQDMPLVVGLEDALGSWATGSGAEERVSEQMAQTDDRAACPIPPEHPQQEVTSEATAAPSSVPSHATDKMKQVKFGRCFYCKKGKHPQETYSKSLKDEADGFFSWDPSGVRRDRDGNLILKTRDGIRAQLYRQLQEDMSDQE